MRPVPDVARRQFGAFTTAQALADGWTVSALRHAAGTGRLDRLRSGVLYAPAYGVDDHQAGRRRAAAAAAAVLLRVPAAVASHGSVALLRGLPVLTLPEVPCVTAVGLSGDLSGAHLHRAPLGRDEIQRRGLLTATTPSRAVVDVARESGVAAGLVVADAALAAGLTDPPALARAVERSAGRPGVRAARAVVALADARAESPLESVSRFELVRGGVPAPDLQPDLYDLDGRFLGRPDLYWDELGVVGEADGAGKYRQPADLYREKRRQDAMEEAGLVVVRWGWQDVRTPGLLVDRAQRAFARARQRAARRGWIARTARCPSMGR